MSIKNKLRAGISFLFLMALIAAGLAAYYLNRLSGDSKSILKDNYRSVVYVKAIGQMLDKSVAASPTPEQLATIEKNIAEEEKNITEPGEGELTKQLRVAFEHYKASAGNKV